MTEASDGNTWVVILAAGEGTRLSMLTTMPSGLAIPKQFCSLRGGPSLLYEAVVRARQIAPCHRICAVVARHHRRWWQTALRHLPDENVFVQPRNRGTAIGMLLSLLHIQQRDRHARVVMLPADHHVRKETILQRAVERAVAAVAPDFPYTMLLGMPPDHADPQLGYIVSGRKVGPGMREVERFVEKPPVTQADELLARGALWNAFIVVSSVREYLGLLHRRINGIVLDLQAAVEDDRGCGDEPVATTALYEGLVSVDFSQDILPGQETRLRVMRVPPCGWSDLGTPQRVADVLEKFPTATAPYVALPLTGYVNRATEHRRLLRATGEIDVRP